MAEHTTKIISENISQLVELKDSLIQVVEDAGSTRELNKRFMQLASENPDDFELMQTLMLMQDISSTNQKNFKASMRNYINVIINSKIESYQELEKLNQRIKTLELERGKQFKIPLLGKVSLRDTLMFGFVVFFILFTSYTVNPEATDSAIKSMSKSTKSAIGVK